MDRRVLIAAIVVLVTMAATWITIGGWSHPQGPSLEPPDPEEGAPGVREEVALQPPIADSQGSGTESDGIVATKPVSPSASEDSEATSLPGDSVWLRGTVVLPFTGPTDEEVWVLARGARFPDGDRVHSAIAEPDGSFTVAFSNRTRYGWVWIESPYLRLDDRIRVDTRNLPANLRLRPKLGGRLIVRVVPPPAFANSSDVLDEVVVTARVQWPGRSERSTKDGVNGWFDLPGLPPSFEYLVEVRSPRFVTATVEGVEVQPARTTEVAIELKTGVQIEGHVVGIGDEGLGGVEVRVRRTGPGPMITKESVRTQHNGAFRLIGVPAGTLSLLATHPDYADSMVGLGALAAGETLTGLIVALDPGLVITGSVRWPNGSPAQCTIRLEPTDSMDDTSKRTGTTKAGMFLIPGLAATRYDIRAHVQTGFLEEDRRGWWADRVGVQPGGNPIELVLSAGSPLRGRVVDDEGGPVKEFSVYAARPDGGLRDHGRRDVQEFFRNDDGRFKLEGLLEGDWETWVYALDHLESDVLEVTAPAPGTELTFTLVRSARISGYVGDSRGRPIPGASVVVRYSKLRGDPGDLLAFTSERGTTTRLNGRFSLFGVHPGPVRLTATAGVRKTTIRANLKPGEYQNNVTLLVK